MRYRLLGCPCPCHRRGVVEKDINGNLRFTPMPKDKFADVIPRLPNGQTHPPLRVLDRELKNVTSFGAVVRGLRHELAGTDIGADFDQELERRGWLKDGELQGRAAQE